MFQRSVAILRETSIPRNTQYKHNFNTYDAKNIKAAINIIMTGKIWHSYVRASWIYLQVTANKMQRFLIFYFHRCSTCFRRFLNLSSGVQKLYIQLRVLSTSTAWMRYHPRIPG